MYPIDGTWMHVAATYDGAIMRLYINGVQEASLATTVPITTNNLPLTIGAQDGTTASRWFMGWMDDARVYNRALSLAEIQALFGNTAPVAVNDFYSTDEDTTLTVAAAGVLGNDTDAESNPLTAIKVTDPANGSLTFNSDGSFTYVPASNFNGSDSFTYKANDGMDSNIATVNITVNAVNDAPVAVDDMAVTDEDTALEITAAVLKANDTDMDNSNAELSVTAVSNPASGTVSLAGGTITFTPDVNASGMGGFDYTVSDGNLNDEGRVIITINAVNDAPVITEGTSTSVTMSEDGSPTPFSLTLNVMDMDTGGGFLTWSIATPASHGTASASGSGLSKVIDYTPTADYNGPDSFVVQVSDGISTDTITVNVTITAVNDAPVITDIPDQTIAEGGSFVTIESR